MRASTAAAEEQRLSQAHWALAEARRAFQRGQHADARRLARQAAALAPELEDPWLLLAAGSAPRASLAYLQRALQVNPQSQRARKGMEWALARLREEENRPPPPSVGSGVEYSQPSTAIPSPSVVYRPATVVAGPGAEPLTVYRATPDAQARQQRAVRLVLVALMLFTFLLVSLSAWGMGLFTQSAALAALGELEGVAPRVGLRDFPATAVSLATLTLVATVEATPVQMATDTSGMPTVTPFAPLTDTPIPTNTATPTWTPTPLPTDTPTATPTIPSTPLPPPTDVSAPPTQTAPPLEPTPKPKKKKPPNVDGPGMRPADVGLTEAWVDVDLSTQMTYAMVGDEQVAQFLVSTGRWPTVTVTGVYRVYVKYRYADMSGSDYYLHNVPYVMYFYKGYGLHGTFWHNNFGTPMSHGCVNLRPEDAHWLFDFAAVGTVVNIHP
jgi:lipoprotein-anchoring transpeptidase ErfK/SrfK